MQLDNILLTFNVMTVTTATAPLPMVASQHSRMVRLHVNWQTLAMRTQKYPNMTAWTTIQKLAVKTAQGSSAYMAMPPGMLRTPAPVGSD